MDNAAAGEAGNKNWKDSWESCCNLKKRFWLACSNKTYKWSACLVKSTVYLFICWIYISPHSKGLWVAYKKYSQYSSAFNFIVTPTLATLILSPSTLPCHPQPVSGAPPLMPLILSSHLASLGAQVPVSQGSPLATSKLKPLTSPGPTSYLTLFTEQAALEWNDQPQNAMTFPKTGISVLGVEWQPPEWNYNPWG